MYSVRLPSSGALLPSRRAQGTVGHVLLAGLVTEWDPDPSKRFRVQVLGFRA